jgi:RND family efflux transporter MFP subunit
MRRIVWTLLLVVGCDPHDPGVDRKEVERKTAQVTVWGDRFEIFLEYEPVTANEPVEFVTHVTDIESAQARREGKLTYILTPPDGPALSIVEDAPTRPGIYTPKLKFPSPGVWKVAIRIAVDGKENLIGLPPVTVHATAGEARKAVLPEVPEGTPFLKEQQWKLLTRIESVGKRRMVERLRLPAVVSARPGGKAAVAPPLAGRLLPPPGRECPPLGGRVEAGEVLGFIQPPVSDLAARMVEAEAEAVRTKLVLDQAKLTHARVKKLAAGEAKTERELQESAFALQMAESAHQAVLALKAAYEKSGATIRSDTGNLPVFEIKSPLKGTVTHIAAAVGEYVPADRALFTILDSDTVLVEARIPESDMARVGSSRDAVYETLDAKGRFKPILGEGGGRIVLLGPEVDLSSRTIPLIYEVQNPEGRLRIGLALNLYLETARAEEALAVPDSALVDEDGLFVAFVQVSGETFRKRDLAIGIRDSGFVQVMDGLSPGERVVTRGAYAVRLASVSTSLPAHGHSH